MKHHESQNQNSLRAYPFTDNADFTDSRPGREPLPAGIIAALKVTSSWGTEGPTVQRLVSVAVLPDFAVVTLSCVATCVTPEFPVPGKPYELTRYAYGYRDYEVCGHVCFGTDVQEGNWAPRAAVLLPRNYVYLPSTGLPMEVTGSISARYVPAARVVMRSAPLGLYAGIETGEPGYISTPAIVLESTDAPLPSCSAADASDCTGAILSVNGEPVPEDGNVEIDSIDPSSIYGDSVPGDEVPGPFDFEESGSSGEPPTVLVDLTMTVPAKCGAELGNPAEARLPVAVRIGATASGVSVQAAFVNDSAFSAIPCFTLSVSADVGAAGSALAPATWTLKTYPPRGSAAVGAGGWATGPLPLAFARGSITPGAVSTPRWLPSLMYLAPPYASGVPGFSENTFSPIGWEDEGTPWGLIPSVANLRQVEEDPPAYESMAPAEYVVLTYFLATTAITEGDAIVVDVSVAAHLTDGVGEIVGKSASKASARATVGGTFAFDVDADPASILEDLLPDYA